MGSMYTNSKREREKERSREEREANVVRDARRKREKEVPFPKTSKRIYSSRLFPPPSFMGKENEAVSFPFHHFSTILRFNVPTTPWRKTLFIYAHRKDRIEYIAIENRTVTFRLVSFLFLLLCPRLPPFPPPL